MVNSTANQITQYKNIIKNSILKYLNRKKQNKYYNKAIVTKYYRIKRSWYKYCNKADTAMTLIKLMILVCYFLLGSVTSWMNIKYPYIIEFKLLLDRDRIDPFLGGKSFIL